MYYPRKEKSNKEQGKFIVPHLAPDYKQEHVNTIVALQRKNDIISMLLDGQETRDIRKYLMVKYDLTQGTANNCIQQGRYEIKKRRNLELHNLISLHLHRYEDIFAKLKKMGAQTYAMDTLRHKEKLLQFHREGFHLRVNKGQLQTIQLQNIDSEYDLEKKLSKQEKARLQELLQKVKRNGPD